MIDCYTFPTPNGRRVTMMLELCQLPYERHTVDITRAEHCKPEFLRLNPARAIPVLIDRDGPGGQPLVLSQSAAICLYLTSKTGRFLPDTARQRSVALQWFMHAICDVGMLASALFRAHACGDAESSTTKAFGERLVAHLRVVDARLAGRPFLADEMSIADIALYPILLSATVTPILATVQDLPHLRRWQASLTERPEIVRGM